MFIKYSEGKVDGVYDDKKQAEEKIKEKVNNKEELEEKEEKEEDEKDL